MKLAINPLDPATSQTIYQNATQTKKSGPFLSVARTLTLIDGPDC